MDFPYLRLEQGAALTSQSSAVLHSGESHDLFCFFSWSVSTISLLQLILLFLLNNCNPFISSITLLLFIWVQHGHCSMETAIKDLIGSWNKKDGDKIRTAVCFFVRNHDCRDAVEADSLPSSSSSCSAPRSDVLVPTWIVRLFISAAAAAIFHHHCCILVRLFISAAAAIFHQHRLFGS